MKRVDTLGCGGGNSCTHRRDRVGAGDDRRRRRRAVPAAERDQPARLPQEMVTQGVKPGQIQIYQSGYNAQNGDLVSSKVVAFGGAEARQALQRHEDRRGRPDRRVPRCPASQPNEFGEMCNREYQDAGGAEVQRDRTRRRTHAYGATVGMCIFVRSIARAIEAAGTEPDAQGPGGRDGGPRCDRHRRRVPRQLRARASTPHPTQLNQMTFHYPCPPDKIPFDGMCIIPEGDAFPIPTPADQLMATDDPTRGDQDPAALAAAVLAEEARAPGGAGRALGGHDPARRPAARRRRERRCRCARRCAPAARRW